MAKQVKKGNSKENYKKAMETEDRDIQRNKRSRSRRSTTSETKDSRYRDWISSEGKPTNDPAWYVNNPVLSRDVGSLWFSRPTGDLFIPNAVTDRTGPQYDLLDPGIMSIPTVITWGGTTYGNEAQDSINLTAQKLYQYVVHANSRNVSYDKKDLIMSMMSIDAIYCLITEAIRAYRLIANYDPQNKYVASLLTALHWNKDDLASNVAQFRYYINWAITRVNKFFMPSLFDVVKAHTSAYEHIYMDRPSMKGQMYVKYSAGVWIYDDPNGSLEYVQEIPYEPGRIVDWTVPHTVDHFRHVVNYMIAQIENSQYMGIMQGDLLKAFGFENMSNYAYIGIDMPITPVYDEEFLFKLHNADICGATSDFFLYDYKTITGASGMIYRDDDAVTGNITSFSGRLFGSSFADLATWDIFRASNGSMVDLPAGIEPSPQNIMLMNLHKAYNQAAVSVKWNLSDSGSVTCCWGKYAPEIMLTATIYNSPDLSNSRTVYTYSGQNVTTMALASRFAHMPLFTEWNMTAGATAHPFFWQTENVTFETIDDMQRIIDVIFWSLWSNSTIANSDATTRETRV